MVVKIGEKLSVSEFNKLESSISIGTKLSPKEFEILSMTAKEPVIPKVKSDILGQPRPPTFEEPVSQLTFTPPAREKLKEPQIVPAEGRIAFKPKEGEFDVTESDII